VHSSSTTTCSTGSLTTVGGGVIVVITADVVFAVAIDSPSTLHKSYVPSFPIQYICVPLSSYVTWHILPKLLVGSFKRARYPNIRVWQDVAACCRRISFQCCSWKNRRILPTECQLNINVLQNYQCCSVLQFVTNHIGNLWPVANKHNVSCKSRVWLLIWDRAHVVVCCGVLQCVAMCCSIMQCIPVRHSVL